MSRLNIPGKPLFLTEEEVFALLDLCLVSESEMNESADCALSKLACLARLFVSEDIAAENAIARAGEIGPNAASPLPSLSQEEADALSDFPLHITDDRSGITVSVDIARWRRHREELRRLAPERNFCA